MYKFEVYHNGKDHSIEAVPQDHYEDQFDLYRINYQGHLKELRYNTRSQSLYQKSWRRLMTLRDEADLEALKNEYPDYSEDPVVVRSRLKEYDVCAREESLAKRRWKKLWYASWPLPQIKESCPYDDIKMTAGEKAVYGWLEVNGYHPYREVKFDSLPGHRFDFWLPSIRTIIEYDGPFHSKIVTDRKTLENRQAKDRLKEKWCEDNAVRLVRVDYRDGVANQLRAKL